MIKNCELILNYVICFILTFDLPLINILIFWAHLSSCWRDTKSLKYPVIHLSTKFLADNIVSISVKLYALRHLSLGKYLSINCTDSRTSGFDVIFIFVSVRVNEHVAKWVKVVSEFYLIFMWRHEISYCSGFRLWEWSTTIKTLITRIERNVNPPGNPIIPIKINATILRLAFLALITLCHHRILILPLRQYFLRLGIVFLNQSKSIRIDYGNNIIYVLGQKVAVFLIFLYQSFIKEPECGE